jgi:DNA-binding NtrC family response regulator
MAAGDARLRGRLLLVDDDPTQLASLPPVLEEHIDVTTAASVRDAVRALEQEPFDVLVTDYEMTGGDGAELLRIALERASNLYTIMITGNKGHDVVTRLQAAGVLVMFKPVDPASLLGWVRSGVAMSQLRKASNRLRRRSGAQ